MKAFHQLTPLGKARRLRPLVLEALRQYDLGVVKLELVGLFTNALWRLYTPSGRSFAVRLCAPDWRTDTDIRSEVMWLEALASDPDIAAPIPLRPRDGDAFVTVSTDTVPGLNRCVVMSWLPGRPLGKQLTERNLSKMGELFAHLHRHGAAFAPPDEFTTRTMASYIARDEPDLLFEGDLISCAASAVQEVMLRTRAVVTEAFHELCADPSELRVIHNDLWHDNIKVYRGRLQPLDFEDTVWGYPVQDIAMAFQDLMTDVPAERYEPLTAAFRRGYEQQSPWPERGTGWGGDQIDTFRVGRCLWVANYVAGHQREHLGAHLDWLVPQLTRFLETGRLRKQP